MEPMEYTGREGAEFLRNVFTKGTFVSAHADLPDRIKSSILHACACMYVCMYVYVCVCMYVCVCVYVCACAYAHACLCVACVNKMKFCL
jgi:hypothetical protein